MFKEEQKFTQIWIWLLLGGLFLFSLYIFTKAVILEQAIGNEKVSKLEGVFFLGIVGLIMLFMWKMRLKSSVDLDGIRIVYAPFVNRYLTWKDVESVEIINYGFVGYGIRFSFKYSWIYNVNGKLGLLVNLKNGKKFVVGTQKSTELGVVLRDLGKL